MKKILETLENKWAEYLLEMIVIVMGILVAFTLNNWNDSRKDKLKEMELLVELKENLTEDINNFKKSVDWQNIRIGKLTKAIIQLESSMPNLDTLLYNIRGTGYFERYEINSSAYETLKNSGFENISSKQLKKKITHYYDVETKHMSFIVERLNNEQRNSIEQYKWKERQTYDGDPEKFTLYIATKGRFYINYLQARIEWKKNFIDDMCFPTINQAEKLIEEIDKELRVK